MRVRETRRCWARTGTGSARLRALDGSAEGGTGEAAALKSSGPWVGGETPEVPGLLGSGSAWGRGAKPDPEEADPVLRGGAWFRGAQPNSPTWSQQLSPIPRAEPRPPSPSGAASLCAGGLGLRSHWQHGGPGAAAGDGQVPSPPPGPLPPASRWPHPALLLPDAYTQLGAINPFPSLLRSQ